MSEINDQNEECSSGRGSSHELDEVQAIGNVIHAMLFYERHAAVKFKRQAKALKQLEAEDRRALSPVLSEHFKQALQCASQNQKLFDQIVNCGMHMFPDNSAFSQAYSKFKDCDTASEHYMSKTRSTLKQIVRDWSKEGESERSSCYARVIKAVKGSYPDVETRHEIQILVPGSGLARLNWELLREGFSVTGNEYSFFMIMTSNFLLNACSQVDEFTMYPYVLDFSNCWSYSDALKPVSFPDVNPSSHLDNQSRRNSFGMCAGDFVSAYADTEDQFHVVVTVFFIDTAANPFKYIKTIKRILKPGGRWINFGPLTYHFEEEEKDSIELPFDVVVDQVRRHGFKMEIVDRSQTDPSLYTSNPNSMLGYTYHCGFFQCVKE